MVRVCEATISIKVEMTVDQMFPHSSFQAGDCPKEGAERSESTDTGSNLDSATC